MLSAAALVACGDKVEVVEQTPPVAPTPHVTSVTVSGPSAYTIGTIANDSLSYAFTLQADAGFTGARTVTWTSSNAAVFRINATSGAGKALASGSTVITATSTVDGVTGQTSLTVTGAAAITPATIVISGIRQGARAGCTGGVAGQLIDLGNACGQVDVFVDVSYNAANRPASITLDLLNPVTGALVANCDSRPFGGQAAEGGADADVSTVQMSCNTDAFVAQTVATATPSPCPNVTGGTTVGTTCFKNGTYLLRASLTGAANTSATPAVTQITVNNADFLRATITGTTAVTGSHPTATATPTTGTQAGRAWNSGSVNAVVLPVLYTAGRSVTTATVQLINASNGAFGAPGGGQVDVGNLNVGGCVAGGLTQCRSSSNPAAADAIACGGLAAQVLSPAAVGGAFSSSVTFSGNDSVTMAGVENVMVDTLIVWAFATDQAGNAVTTVRTGSTSQTNGGSLTIYGLPVCGGPGASTAAIGVGAFLRLDNRDPGASMFDPRVPLQGANDEFTINGQNSAFLGSSITFPTTATATNGLVVGADAGANSNTVAYQFANAGTVKTGAWTNITCTGAAAGTLCGIPATSTPFSYWIRTITRDILGNADTTRIELGQASCLANPPPGGATAVGATGPNGTNTGIACGAAGNTIYIAPTLVGDNGTDPTATCTPSTANTTCAATFGVDVVAPTAQIATGVQINGAFISSWACSQRQYQVVGTSSTLAACAAPRLNTGNNNLLNPATYSMSDPLAANGATGSQFGATPVNYAIRRINASGVSLTGSVTTCIDPTTITSAGGVTGDTFVETAATAADPSCSINTKPVSVAPLLPYAPGVFTVTWNVSDEANNRSATASFSYVIDNTGITVTQNPVTIPTSITAGSTFSTSGNSFQDNLDVMGGNGFLYYPDAGNIMIQLNGTATGAGASATDATLSRQADVSVQIPTTEFYRSLFLRTGPGPRNFMNLVGKPNLVGIRAWDGGRNLSQAVVVNLPPTNISGGANPFFTGGARCLAPATNCDYDDFVLTSASNVSSGAITSVDLTAVLTAPSNSLQTAFSQVCFYFAKRGVNAATTTESGPTWSPVSNTYTTQSNAPATGGLATLLTGQTTGGTAFPTFSAGYDMVSAGSAYPANGVFTSGDLIKVGCVPVPVVTGGGTAGQRSYTYTLNHAISAALRAGGGSQVRYFAIGVDANGDAVISVNTSTTGANPGTTAWP